MNDINLINSCQAQLPAQYAQITEFNRQTWHWCCDWHLSCTCKTSLMFAPLAVLVYTGCPAFPFYTPTKQLIQLHIKYQLFCFLNYSFTKLNWHSWICRINSYNSVKLILDLQTLWKVLISDRSISNPVSITVPLSHLDRGHSCKGWDRGFESHDIQYIFFKYFHFYHKSWLARFLKDYV